MRILILKIILIFTISAGIAQEYDIRIWKYPWGSCLGYNDSVLGDYDKDKDVILHFNEFEHAICKVKIGDKRYLRFYRLHPFYIYEIEVLDIFGCYKSFNQDSIKKISYCVLLGKDKICKDSVVVGTFTVYNNYIIFQRAIELKKETKYYISQRVIIWGPKGLFYKRINKLNRHKKNK